MSPTTNDLRERLAQDVAAFGTLPSVADKALAQGRRTRRHRGATFGVLGAVAATVAVAALTTGGTGTATPVDPGAGTPSLPAATGVPPSPELTPMPPSDDWNEHVVDTMSALLPERFDEVSIHRGYRDGGLPLFRVDSPTQEIEFYIVFGDGYGYDVGTCEPLVWWMSSCLPADLPAPARARAFHEVVAASDSEGGGLHHVAGAELGAPGLDATLTITPVTEDVPIEEPPTKRSSRSSRIRRTSPSSTTGPRSSLPEWLFTERSPWRPPPFSHQP